mmetsp:Transcript_50195/g.107235  ORF Transcript_50195/g.107235 Transcript_50195/m.107235 type:complete len:286 (+) Transcript_50195:104-961(+)
MLLSVGSALGSRPRPTRGACSTPSSARSTAMLDARGRRLRSHHLHGRGHRRHVAAAGAEGAARRGGGGVELDALGGEELAERRLGLDWGLEGVVLARGARVLDELVLDDHLDLLAAVRNVVDLLGVRGWDADDAILVADDGISRADDNLAALDHTVALPRLHRCRALLGRRRVREYGETVAEQLVRVAHRAVGHEATHAELLQPEELDVATDGLPRPDRGHHQDGLGPALLECLILRGLHAGRLVCRNVRALRYEAKRDGTACTLLPLSERARSLDERGRPAHHP